MLVWRGSGARFSRQLRDTLDVADDDDDAIDGILMIEFMYDEMTMTMMGNGVETALGGRVMVWVRWLPA